VVPLPLAWLWGCALSRTATILVAHFAIQPTAAVLQPSVRPWGKSQRLTLVLQQNALQSRKGRRRGESLRVGIAENPYDAPIDDSVVTAVEKARRGFERCGAEVTDCDVPFASETAQLWGELLFCETQALLLPVIREHGSAQINTLVDTYSDAYRQLDITGLLAGMQQRIQYQRAWSRLFDDIDVLVMPTSLKTAFENDLDFKQPANVPGILQAQQPLCSVNLLGLPAVAMPTHVQNGVPVGVQLIGSMHDDYFLLDAADQLEREIGTVLGQLPR